MECTQQDEMSSALFVFRLCSFVLGRKEAIFPLGNNKRRGVEHTISQDENTPGDETVRCLSELRTEPKTEEAKVRGSTF